MEILKSISHTINSYITLGLPVVTLSVKDKDGNLFNFRDALLPFELEIN